MLLTATETSQPLPAKDGEFASLQKTGRARAGKGQEQERAGFPARPADQRVLLAWVLPVGTWVERAGPLSPCLASLPANKLIVLSEQLHGDARRQHHQDVASSGKLRMEKTHWTSERRCTPTACLEGDSPVGEMTREGRTSPR